MKLSMYFTPVGLTQNDVAGRPVLMVDVLLAGTTMVTAMANGAKSILPAESAADALALVQKLQRDDLLLAGEKGGQPIEGFQLGNSPREMIAEKVAGMTITMTTSNGTEALIASGHGAPVLIGAAVNFTAAVRAAKAAFQEAGDLVIVCGGRQRRFALEDAYVAGRFAREILPSRARGVEVDDAAIGAQQLVRRYGERWKSAVDASASARYLKGIGRAQDVAAAIEIDKYDIVPRYVDRQVNV